VSYGPCSLLQSRRVPRLIVTEAAQSVNFEIASEAWSPIERRSNRGVATLQIGQTAPDFTLVSTEGEIRFHDWLGDKWGVLFSHPKNFTPVCTTELGEVARLKLEWEQRNVKVIGLSVDTLERHEEWAVDIEETQGQIVNFPLLSDPSREVAGIYGMVHPESDPLQTVRAVFIIDPKKKIRLVLSYPPSAGRNFAEILRVIDSLQLSDREAVATPVNWVVGDPVIVSLQITDDQVKERFPQGVDARKPYLRYVNL
jgi:alkyl hydroperoxide reductase subunit AhpC